MLIHITPKFFTCDLSGPNVELVDLQIEELNLTLHGGKDLTARRPYPNKRYVVACRKVGAKAIDGILVETPGHVPVYTVVTRWALSKDLVVTHRVRHPVLDTDFDTVTDSMTMWHAMCESLGGWGSCRPAVHEGAVPCNAQPRMQLTPDPERSGDFTDRTSGGAILERVETFRVPTIERERLLSRHRVFERIPTIESAFKAG